MRILLADHSPNHRRSRGRNRASLIKRTLETRWKAEVILATTPETARKLAEQSRQGHEPFDIVLIAFAFGGPRHGEIARDLCRGAKFTALISDVQQFHLLPCFRKCVKIPYNVARNDPCIVQELEKALPERPSVLPTPAFGRSGRILAPQIARLHSRGELEDGKKILSELMLRLVGEISKFDIRPLGQGFSGASVFHVGYKDPTTGRREQRVLKLTKNIEEHIWKCGNELRHREQIESLFGGRDVRMAPAIHAACDRVSGSLVPAENDEGTWLAVMYDFVGEEEFSVVDFERAYIDPQDCIDEAELDRAAEELPRWFLDILLRRLRDRLRRRDVCGPSRMCLWSGEELGPYAAPEFTPFQFRRLEKLRLAESLRSLKPYGQSLSCRGWDARWQLAVRCLPTMSSLPARLEKLGDRHQVLLGPVHGDLNANNMLMILREERPYLIDFAFFQPRGQVAQDFARLEVTIKLQLMGQEKGGPSGKDLNSSEFPKWCDAEQWLAGWPKTDDDLDRLGPDSASVRRAFALCRFVRETAEEFHREALGSSFQLEEFQLGYHAALLYHTLRAVGYDSLSHLKRILAIYSAGGVVERLR